MDIEGYLEASVEMKNVAVPVDIAGSFEIKYEDNLETSKNSTAIKVCFLSLNKKSLWKPTPPHPHWGLSLRL